MLEVGGLYALKDYEEELYYFEVIAVKDGWAAMWVHRSDNGAVVGVVEEQADCCPYYHRLADAPS